MSARHREAARWPGIRWDVVARSLVCVIGVTVWGWGTAAQAVAQPADVWPGSFEVVLGGIWSDAYELGSSSATLTPNNGTSTPFTLFTSETELLESTGFEARVGYHATRVVAIEGGFSFTKPRAVASISEDAEGAPPAAAEERLSQYVVDGSLVVHLTPLAFASGRGLPFVSVGSGYLRQLHEGDFLVETGQVYHLAGGVKHLFVRRADGFVSGLGARFDVRANVREGGFELEDERRTFGAASAGLVLLF